MRINISSGDCLNEILQSIYKSEKFIPFREAMIKGSYTSEPFSDEFCDERAKTHGVSKEDYLEKLSVFIEYLNHADDYETTVLWFGDEPFCIENRKIILKSLSGKHYKGKIVLNIVNEETGEILSSSPVEIQ